MPSERINLDRSSSDFGVKLFEHLRQLTYDLAKNPENAEKWSFLRYYQNIIREYFNTINMKSRGLLVFLPPGMGKTLAAVAVAIDQLEDRFPVILASKSLHENFHVGIKKYIAMRTKADPMFALGKIPEEDLDKWINRNFGFVSMNASNMIDQLVKESEGQVGKEFRKVQSKVERKRIKEGQYKAAVAVGSLDDKLLIVDEAHNLFRAITNGSKNGIELYNMVMKARNLKILFLTGTMPVNDPFEFVPCFNMLAETEEGTTLFPESYSDFRRMFISERKIGISDPDDVIGVSKLKMENKDKFQNRIYGLVSRVGYNTMLGKGIIDMAARHGDNIEFSSIGLTGESQPVNFPKVLPLKVRFIPMTKKQYSMYLIARNKELEEYKVKRFRRGNAPSMQKPKSTSASTYKQKSRQMSNFAPPADLGLVRFSDIDMDKIDEKDVDSVKLDALYKEIMSLPGIGYVYSQFVGAGGLGSIMKYFEKKGWEIFSGQKRIVTGKPPKRAQTRVTTAIPSNFADAVVEEADDDEDIEGAEGGDEAIEGGDDSALLSAKKLRLGNFEKYMSRIDEFATAVGGSVNAKSRIYFAVNGQTDLCAAGKQIGAKDVHLNNRGIEQAGELAQKLRKKNIEFAKIFVADSPRSRDLLNVISDALKISDVANITSVLPSLSPRNGGILDGLHKDAVREILDEAGRRADEGLKGLEMEFIMETLIISRDILISAGKLSAAADITNLLAENNSSDFVAQLLSKEETESEFVDRIKLSFAEIKKEIQSMNKCNFLVIAPNNVYVSLLKLLGKNVEEMAPTKLHKIKLNEDIMSIIDTLAGRSAETVGGFDIRPNMMQFLDNVILKEKAVRCAANKVGGALRIYGGADSIRGGADSIRGGADSIRGGATKSAEAAKPPPKGKNFAYFSGEVDVEDRETIRMTFNSRENAEEGDKIRTLLLSATGAEGLDLENARWGIAYEPYWVWPRLEQVFARGVRHNSHVGLPKEDQNFQPILFIAVKPGTENFDYVEYVKRMVAGAPNPGDEEYMTTDLELYIESLITNDLNKQFAEAVYEVSIECVLNGEEKCRMCAPNGAKLFGPDIDADMRKPNMCEQYKEDSIEALEIIVDGVTYYYSHEPHTALKYKIYEYDEALGNYREMDKTSDLYSEIIDAIVAHEGKK